MRFSLRVIQPKVALLVTFANMVLSPVLDLIGYEPSESDRIAIHAIAGAVSALVLGLTGNTTTKEV